MKAVTLCNDATGPPYPAAPVRAHERHAPACRQSYEQRIPFAGATTSPLVGRNAPSNILIPVNAAVEKRVCFHPFPARPPFMTLPDAWPVLWHAAADNLDLFGLLGICLGFATGLMPQRRMILLTSAACGLCFSVHFLRLGSSTGMAMNLISVAQSLLAARYVTASGRPVWLNAAFAAAALLAITLTVSTWNGWPSAFAGLAALLAAAARLQSSSQALRVLLIGAGLLWASHNVLVGSVCGLTCDCLGLIALIAAFLREHAFSRRLRFTAVPSLECSCGHRLSQHPRQ